MNCSQLVNIQGALILQHQVGSPQQSAKHVNFHLIFRFLWLSLVTSLSIAYPVALTDMNGRGSDDFVWHHALHGHWSSGLLCHLISVQKFKIKSPKWCAMVSSAQRLTPIMQCSDVSTTNSFYCG